MWEYMLLSYMPQAQFLASAADCSKIKMTALNKHRIRYAVSTKQWQK